MASATTTLLRSPASIEILTLTAVSAGSLRAFASVQIGPALTVHKFRVIQQVGQRAWVSPPQERWEDREGQAKYTPLVELTGGLKTRVEVAVLAAALAHGVISAVSGR
jgi:DNA-binding cell septation regulator SpoVG